MKITDRMSRAICQLEKMYNTINLDKFGGTLPVPIITVQSKPGSMGHCTVAKIWRRAGDETYELNIAAEVLDWPVEETVDTLIHEMIHLYCRENDIKECSRGGAYHNKKFKQLAEEKGLETYQCGNAGWKTKAGEKTLEYCIEKGWSEIRIGRTTYGKLAIPGPKGPKGSSSETEQGGKKPTHIRKYTCPKCGNSVRASKAVNIICGDCMVKMET